MIDGDRLCTKYTGEVARGYDEKRQGSTKWLSEHAAVASILESLPTGLTLLDVPIGTGRFVDIYKNRAARVVGLDASPDMLAKAREKAARVGIDIQLLQGDIRAIRTPDKAFDAAVCIRIANWLERPALTSAFRELARVTRSDIIIGVRHYIPWRQLLLRHPGQGALALAHQSLTRTTHGLRGRSAPHVQAFVLSLFPACGWRMRQSHTVERRGDGTEYVIYHLVPNE